MINSIEQKKREKEDIIRMLKNNYKKSEICKALGICPKILNEKIRKYEIND